MTAVEGMAGAMGAAWSFSGGMLAPGLGIALPHTRRQAEESGIVAHSPVELQQALEPPPGRGLFGRALVLHLLAHVPAGMLSGSGVG
jgi:hypothetical protein